MNKNGNKRATKAELLAFLKKMLTTDATWAKAALLRIYDAQTWDEKNSEETHYDNGVGFTGADAGILTRFAEWYKAKGWLSPKMMALVHKKIGKYAAQLMNGSFFKMDKLEAAYLRSVA